MLISTCFGAEVPKHVEINMFHKLYLIKSLVVYCVKYTMIFVPSYT